MKSSADKSLPSLPSMGTEADTLGAQKSTTGKTSNSTALQEFDSLLQDTTSPNHVENSTDDELDFSSLTIGKAKDRISAFQDDATLNQLLENDADLQEQLSKVEKQKGFIQRELESDYTKQVQSFIELHSTIESCDQVLGRLEGLLTDFQSDLGNISGEIQTLQERSSYMSLRLKNRKAVESKLSRALQGMVIPPYMIKKITEEEVDDMWTFCLLEINKQMSFVKTNQNRSVPALKDVGPTLENLRLKAASTIRDFFLSRIQSLCVANANIQIMQQSVFLKYKELYLFLLDRHRDAAAEIKQAYINSLRWYFQNHFERYCKGLSKLQTLGAEKTDLIGVDENARKGSLFGKAPILKKMNFFSTDNRIDVLQMQDTGVILVHVAEDKQKKYHFEQLFRSFNLALIDNASSEYMFITDFFSQDEKTGAEIAKSIFQQIFDLTEKIGTNFTKTYVDTSHDVVGILLCIRVNSQLGEELHRREVPVLQPYIDSTNMLLWPRFQYIMSLHIESLKKLGNSRSMLSAVKDVHPHYITCRYATFSASLLILNERHDDAILTNSVMKLRNEFEGLLLRISREFSEPLRQWAFLINNYDLVVGVLQEAHSPAVETELAHTRQILSLHMAAFVDEQLKTHFGSLCRCVTRIGQEGPSLDEIASAGAQFKQTWRASIMKVNTSVIQHFSNVTNRTAVLHAVLKQLIHRYNTLFELAEQRGAQVNSLVSVDEVMVEVKKFSKAF